MGVTSERTGCLPRRIPGTPRRIPAPPRADQPTRFSRIILKGLTGRRRTNLTPRISGPSGDEDTHRVCQVAYQAARRGWRRRSGAQTPVLHCQG